jgi:hypothetical protein
MPASSGRSARATNLGPQWVQPLEAAGGAIAASAYNKNIKQQGGDAAGAAVLETLVGTVVAAFTPGGHFLHETSLGVVAGAISSMIFGA